MKLIASGVANCAAIVRSPSFSRAAASTTTTNFPARMSSIASSTLANGACFSRAVAIRRIVPGLPCRQALDVLREDVDLEVDVVAGLDRAKRGRLERVADECHLERILGQPRDRQRDAVDGDRALIDAVAKDVGRRVDRDAAAVAFGLDGADATGPVDMPLHVMPAERIAGPQGGLQVDLGPELLGACERFGHYVEGERAVGSIGHRQADAVDSDGVANGGIERGRDDEPATVERLDLRALANDAGEHARSVRGGAGMRPPPDVTESPQARPTRACISSLRSPWAAGGPRPTQGGDARACVPISNCPWLWRKRRGSKFAGSVVPRDRVQRLAGDRLEIGTV